MDVDDFKEHNRVIDLRQFLISARSGIDEPIVKRLVRDVYIPFMCKKGRKTGRKASCLFFLFCAFVWISALLEG